ncbi:MAG TPA: hypothetical protein VEM95_01895 [Thermoplasmata archaeon]|nr:hypothetical protein [Thermoplasmata archaeon]
MFLTLGVGGALLAMYLIFVVDASIIPTVPEVFIVGFFTLHTLFGLTPVLWALALLATALAGEATGNTALYVVVKNAIVRRGMMPRRVERWMRRWTDFLLLHDERIILLNRVIPVVPFVGAFIAALDWDYRRSLAYIVAGAGAKYAALLFLVGAVGVAYDPAAAGWITLVLVLGLVGASGAGAYLYRRKKRSTGGAP